MAGYNYLAGMSNNAVAAYSQGIKPLSKITAQDLRDAGWKETKALATRLAKAEEWQRSEWHHSGGTYYNQVDFYNPDDLVAWWSELSEAERAQRKEILKAKPAANVPAGRRVKGRYAEFTGSRRKPRFSGYVEFTGILNGDWIALDGGGRKKAGGGNIEWQFV